jgi:hypothetical protein
MTHALNESERDRLNRYFIDKPVSHDIVEYLLHFVNNKPLSVASSSTEFDDESMDDLSNTEMFILDLAKKMIPVETSPSPYKGTIESWIHYENDDGDDESNISVRKDAEQWDDTDIVYTCVFWLEQGGHVMYEKNNQTHKDEIVKGMVMLFDGETTYIPYIGKGYQRYIIVQLVTDS